MSRGIQRERQVKKLLEAEGWWVCRAAGSLGDADLVALKPDGAMMVEVKSTITPYSHFGPADRAELLRAAEMTNARPVLAWWPKYGKLQWIDAAQWPGQKFA